MALVAVAALVLVAQIGEVFEEAELPTVDVRFRVAGTATPDEVVESLQARVEAGVQSFILHTMTPDPAQLEQWATHIIPHVRFPVEDR